MLNALVKNSSGPFAPKQKVMLNLYQSQILGEKNAFVSHKLSGRGVEQWM
jgi:hypothetical protein